MWRSKGFTLIEVIVVIAVLATLAGMLTPLAMRLVERQEGDLTEQRLKAAYQAVAGSWDQGDFGFLGDIGRLPNSLDELVLRGSLPAYAVGANGVGLGWRGPYIQTIGEDFKRDAWGRPLVFNSATGQVTSLGPDGVVSADDITYPQTAPVLQGGLQVSVLEDKGGGNYVPATANTTVTVYYSNGGAQTSVQTAVSPYVVLGLHPGMHAVHAHNSVTNADGWLNARATTGVSNVQLIMTGGH
jgi:general secretion pathway protein G